MDNDDNEKLISTRRAIERFCERQLKKEQNELKPSRKNQKPEKLTEAQCLYWMRKKGWKVQIYESKATYSQIAKRWINQSMQAGVADCQGTMPDGRSIAVEFKAKGKLSTFWKPTNYRQQEFILDKINLNAFACVVDSVELLEAIYKHWQCRLVGGATSAQNCLRENLPKKPNRHHGTKQESKTKLSEDVQKIKDHLTAALEDDSED